MSSNLNTSAPEAASAVPESPGPEVVGHRASRGARLIPQVGLSTLLLATACFAVWWNYYSNLREIAKLDSRLAATRPLARELSVKDRSLLAIVKQHETRHDEQIWHLYVPDDSFSLHLTTRDVPAQISRWIDPVTTPVEKVPLRPGTHVVELISQLYENAWTTEVVLDKEVVISVVEPKEWNSGSGWSGGTNYEKQTEFPPGTRAVLLERLFTLPGRGSNRLPTDRGNGILLWIE